MKKTGLVGSSLDHLIGKWTAAEADEMESALEDFEKIDEVPPLSDDYLGGCQSRPRWRQAARCAVRSCAIHWNRSMGDVDE